nr:circadian clock protein PASD1 [Aotus nancymaae]
MKMSEKKRRDKVNPESSQKKLNWMPSFRTYDEFNQMTLQSLDGFMIALSTDGVIIYVDENISSILGHVSPEIVDKKLLNLLPDEEKNEVSQKIILEYPLSNSETHIEFCCHLKRGNVEYGDGPAYEYVKFILNVKYVSDESAVFFSSFCSSRRYAELSPLHLSWEDHFYLIGTVCILRTQLLQRLYTSRELSDKFVFMQDSDEEPFVGDLSRSQDQRGHTSMEVVCAEPAAAAAATLDDRIEITQVEQHGPQDVCAIAVASDSAFRSSAVSLDNIPKSPALLSLQGFKFEPEVNPLYKAEPVDLEFSVDQEDSVDQEGSTGQQDPENLADLLDQTDLTDSVVTEDSVDLETAGTSAQPSQPLSPVVYGIFIQELDRIKKLKEQLEKRNQMLHHAIQNQQDALEVLMDRLQTSQDARFQKQPNASQHTVSPDHQPSEAVPMKQQKQHTENVKRSFPHPKEVKRVGDLSLNDCLKNTRKLQEPCAAFTQQQLAQEEQRLKEQLQQLREQRKKLQEQKMQEKKKLQEHKMQEKKKLQEHKMQEKKKLQEQRQQRKNKLQERKKWQLLPKGMKKEQQTQQLQEQPLKHNIIVGNHKLKICLQNPSGVTEPLCNNPVRFLQTQPIVVLNKMVAEQQLSGYQDGNSGQQEDESQR